MRLGLITDVHEHVEHLRRALGRLREAGADRLVFLGDAFETGPRLAETIALLSEAKVPGVWGNHDYGLCVDPCEDVRAHYPPEVFAYMSTLRPRLVLDGLLLQHTEPRGDPEDVLGLWPIDDWPPTPEALALDFAAFDQRLAFVGHRHRWSAHTPEGPLPWSGPGPLRLPGDRRCVVVVHAVVDGWCALYDAEADVITPVRLG